MGYAPFGAQEVEFLPFGATELSRPDGCEEQERYCDGCCQVSRVVLKFAQKVGQGVMGKIFAMFDNAASDLALDRVGDVVVGPTV